MSFELTLDNIKRSYLTIGFVSVNIIIFIVVNLILGDEILYLLSQYNLSISQGRELWSLITSNYVHMDFIHLFNNVVGLLIYGSMAEKYYSKWQYLMIYIISGFVGSVFSYLLSPLYIYGLGASGVVYGFPKERAARIALNTVEKFLKANKLPEKVVFMLFGDENYRIYKNLTKTDA